MNILDRHDRLKTIGNLLLQNKRLSDEDRLFLGNALVHIGNGEDVRVSLDIKVGRGQDSYKSALNCENRKRLAMGFVATAKAPVEEGGLGLTHEQVKELIANVPIAEEFFGLDADTIESYWNHNPDMRTATFKLRS